MVSVSQKGCLWQASKDPGRNVAVPVLKPLALQAALTNSRNETPGPAEVSTPTPECMDSLRRSAFEFSVVLDNSSPSDHPFDRIDQLGRAPSREMV
jgi:hypothetical protein